MPEGRQRARAARYVTGVTALVSAHVPLHELAGFGRGLLPARSRGSGGLTERTTGVRISKLSKALYYARRPAFWPFGVERARRALKGGAAYDRDDPSAGDWAAARAVPVEQAMRDVGILAEGVAMPAPVDSALLAEGEAARAASGVKMGGPGDLELIHAVILATGATRVVETGVAYGWSSLVILDALGHTDGRLVSVDMPYVGAGLETHVGLVVPQRMRDRWTLLREPDRNGIRKALARFGGTIDLAHYDSDKSYPGRHFAYPLLWAALRPGGVLISDDIQDNFGFRDYAEGLGVPFAVTESTGKQVGVLVKPR